MLYLKAWIAAQGLYQKRYAHSAHTKVMRFLVICGGALLDRVSLLLERSFATHSDKAKLGMRFGFRCLFFQWILLVRFAKSQGFCCLSGQWFFCTFIETAVVVS